MNTKERLYAVIGGCVGTVFGNGSSKGKAVMGINRYGNGAVSTWDKNEYRQ